MHFSTSRDLKRYSLSALFLFVLLFILTVPFPYNLLPDTGKFTAPIFEALVRFSARYVFHLSGTYVSEIISDSTGYYIHAFNLVVIAIILATAAWLLKIKLPGNLALGETLLLVCRWFLALHMLSYGLNKVFKWQFFLPEPNTLFTDIGATPKDLLFWSTMGASRAYCIFCGAAEVTCALLLIFRRAQVAGALLTFLVMTNVLAINLCFDISVKGHSFFLLLLSLIIIVPGIPQLKGILGFRSLKVNFQPEPFYRYLFTGNVYRVGKLLVAGLLVTEAFIGYARSGNFNDDRSPRPFMHGAYEVTAFEKNGENIPLLVTGESTWRRVFVHRDGYFIIQFMNDQMQDFELLSDPLSGTFFLKHTATGENSSLQIATWKNDVFEFSGDMGNDHLKITARKLELEQLPLAANQFRWTLD